MAACTIDTAIPRIAHGGALVRLARCLFPGPQRRADAAQLPVWLQRDIGLTAEPRDPRSLPDPLLSLLMR
jgi:hypothetical protein